MSELPQGWASTTLGEIGEYLNGRGFKKSEWREFGGRPIIRIQNLTGSGSHFNYFDGEAEERYIARDGDLLVSWAATLGVFVWRGPEAVVNQHIFKVESRVDREFHRYLLLSTLDALQHQTHGSGMVHITKSRFDATPVALPPFNEQRRIVAAIEEQFSRLDAAQAGLEAASRRLTGLRDAALVRAFYGDYAASALVDVSDACRPICYGILKPKTTGNLVVPYVEVRSIRQGRIDVSSLHRTTQALHDEFARSELRGGDVVLAIRGSWDRAAVVPDELTGANVSRDVARIAPGDDLDARYLAHFLASPVARRYFAAAARGVGVRGVNIGDLRKLPIPVPPLREQRGIVTRAERDVSAIDALDSGIQRAQRRSALLRRALLERAFRGELVPQDPSDEPASLLLERARAERAAAPPPSRRRRVSA